MSGRSSAATSSPISRTSFSRLSLPLEALEHLQVRDRAKVARRRGHPGALDRLLLVEDDPVLPLRLRGHHRRLGARRELARVHGVVGPVRETDRDGDPADGGQVDGGEPQQHALGDADRVDPVAAGS